MKPLNLRPLGTEEFMRFFEQLLASIDTGSTAEPAALTGAKTAITQKLADMDALYKHDRASELTAVLLALDATRDSYVTGLAKVFDGYTMHHDPAQREAAGRLAHTLALYGPDITKQNYQKETGIIKGFVDDCRDKPDLVAAVRSLSLGSWIDALRAANDELDRKFLERNALNAEADIPYTFLDKRLEMKEAYENLLNKLMAFYHTAEGADPWGTIVRRVEGLTEEYRVIVARRQGRKEAKASEGAQGS